MDITRATKIPSKRRSAVHDSVCEHKFLSTKNALANSAVAAIE
jgi:hypothetical protein